LRFDLKETGGLWKALPIQLEGGEEEEEEEEEE